ncbi:GAF and ANTAR domain-containing protein [Nocardioides renjunii]|uniref:GAF and ANTAR domain-containing protein n=1 Tax=Nocardioides renjunii TaxID=3095075 RepID=UPI002AFF0D2B|nr:GAF and ANTAR domain-containing protein [Nocardioides sp. S-34]WQQ22793.1 GAF and ANTAR domain-containing protein [Nocardioides sp. S-34]
MSFHDSVAVFAALAADLQQEPDEALTSRAVVLRMRELVPDADALQYALDEGPCLQVADAGGWLRSGDVGADARWPAWGPRAASLGVRSLLAVEITDRDGPLGALNLYSGAGGAFAGRDVVDLALAYAAHATTALSSAHRAGALQAAVSSRHVIGMAQGIAMERYGIDQQQSFELLRRLSSTTNVKLRDVAAQIVETRVVPHDRASESVDD